MANIIGIKKKKKQEKKKEELINKLAEQEKAKIKPVPPPSASKPEVKIFGQSPMVIVGIGGTIFVLGIIIVVALSKRKSNE